MTKTKAIGPRAFTLVELLIVIAIIAILAAMIFPVVGAVKRRAAISKAETELNQVKTSIELYKEKFGYYPPDNPLMPATNQLFYELSGTELGTAGYKTLDGSETIQVAQVAQAFGPNVSGFVNTTKGGGDETASAKSFLKGLKPGQSETVTNNGVRTRLLTCSVTWPANTPFEEINPWRYNSSNPTNNPGSYDLWVDILIRGKTNRISNWSQQAQIVYQP